MKKETFDYSQVSCSFGLCAAAACLRADTCLRRIAYDYALASIAFPLKLNPKTIEEMSGKCKYYCPDTKMRYAKGFRTLRKP